MGTKEQAGRLLPLEGALRPQEIRALPETPHSGKLHPGIPVFVKLLTAVFWVLFILPPEETPVGNPGPVVASRSWDTISSVYSLPVLAPAPGGRTEGAYHPPPTDHSH